MSCLKPQHTQGLRRALVALVLLGSSGIYAQTEAPAASALYTSLGGQAGIHRIVATLTDNILADSRIKDYFKETNLKRFKEKLEEQICEVAGGPCKYTGDSMVEVHKGLKIDRAGFNALVEDLQAAMDVEGVPFAQQNKLLVLLAPMHRNIVTR